MSLPQVLKTSLQVRRVRSSRLAARRSLLLRLRKRFDVSHQRHQVLFRHLALEGRHDGLESGNDLRARIQDGFSDVVLVGHNCASVVQQHRLAEDTYQVWSASLSIEA